MASKVQIKRSSVPSKVPTTADLDLGELAINTYDGKVFLKKSVAGTESIVDLTSAGPTGQYIISSQQIFTANANQTTFSVNYTVGYVDVHLNGIKLVSGQDFTATNGSSVVLTTAASAGDIVDITAGNTFSAGAGSANGIMPVELGGTGSGTASGARTNLGLGNVENKSSATIRSELTSTNVTTALGFTPYNSANPSGYISGNQTITFSGDATGSGTTGVALTLANSGVTAGTYGNANSIPQIAVDAKGRITSVTNVGVNIPSGSLTFTGDVTGTGTTGSTTTLTLANSGVTVGTYRSVTVDAKGRVTGGTNPTTLSGYGITDAQPLDSDLTAIAALAPTADNFIVGNGTTWILETPAQARASLGGTTAGQNLFTVTNPSAVTFIRINADNTVSTLDAATFRTAIGAYAATNPSGYISGNQTITFSGDATGSGATSVALTLANSGVTAGTYTKVTVDAKGRATSGTTLSASDIPSLDASKITSGVIDAARLPSYVDDVLEFANLAGFPATGETGKIYVALDTNKAYRWSGTVYVYITSGAVDSVAGKTGVVTLNNADVGLGNVENKSSATIRGELTSANVTTALGFTPYNSTNPSGYITSSALSSYLPLTGGTLTGDLQLGGNFLRFDQSGTRSWNIRATGGNLDVASGDGSGLLRYNGGVVITSNNYTSYSPTLTGSGASGTWGISITGNAGTAGGLSVHAGVNNEANKIVRTDGSGYIYTGWISTTSGDNGTTAIDRIYASHDTWLRYYTPANFRTVLDVPTRGGTGASGTWGVNITGSHPGTHTGELTAPNFIIGGQGRSSLNAIGGNIGSTAPSWNNSQLEIKNTDNGTVAIALHRAGYTSNTIDVRDTSGIRIDGSIALHAANYTSYSPTLTGSGASGTWGISITGSAATLGGKPAQDAVGANTIPTRDGSGYTYFNYINSNTGNSENPSVSQVIVTNGSDGFYRKASIAHLTSAVQSNASGTWSINVTGSAGSASTASTANALATGNNYQMNSLGVGTGAGGGGEIRATSNITAYYSDDRLKTRLGLIENALDKLCSLSGFYYEANEVAQSLGYTPVREVGLSAQETQRVLPEVVVPAPIDDKYLTIRYEKVIPLIVEAIKELRAELVNLKQAQH